MRSLAAAAVLGVFAVAACSPNPNSGTNVPIGGNGSGSGSGGTHGSSTSSGGGGPTCPGSQILCSGLCSDTTSDPANCGGCIGKGGVACAPGELCSAGACVASCLTGELLCSSLCTNPLTDSLNCGGCAGDGGTDCPSGQVCNDGGCAETCAEGYSVCGTDGGVDGGFEYCANLQQDSLNCGACGTACPPGQVCTPGAAGAAATCAAASTATDGGSSDGGGPSLVVGGVAFVGTSYPFLGVDYHASYNINPVNTFTFQVQDVTGQTGVPNIAVAFSAEQSNAAGSQLLTASGTTDSKGNVAAQVQSGQQSGPIGVIATVTAAGHTYSATGTSNVVGTQPSVAHSGMVCNPVNLPAYTDNQAPCGTGTNVSATTTCTVTLGDRFGNAIQVKVPVQFFAEAGNWQSAAVHTPDYGQASSTQPPGTATNVLQESGAALPQDVDPLPPIGLLPAEPSYDGACAGGARTFNPRDGLVTVIAVFTGEEPFKDLTGSGYWQPGDPFVDLPQPFVDNDDSSTYKPLDLCPGKSNGSCGGPNHVWDGAANVWVETRIVYSGDPAFTTWAPDGGVDIVPVTGPVQGEVTWSDVNLNTPACSTSQCATIYSVVVASGPTSVQVTYPAPGFPSNPGDLLGMTVTQLEDCDGGYIVTDGGQQPNPVCDYRTVVYDFKGGFTGTYNAAESSSACSAGNACPIPICLEAPAHYGSDQPAQTSEACFGAK